MADQMSASIHTQARNEMPDSVSAKLKPKSFYRPELDALRFFAFFMVFLFHLLPDRASNIPFVRNPHLQYIISSATVTMGAGVCLFFILSAYLITTLMIRERQLTSSFDIRAFYERRILRIWPLYFFALLLAFPACTVFRGFPGFKAIAAYFLMAGNLGYAFHIHFDILPLRIAHLWSISVEEQFYLIFPFISSRVKIRYLPIISLLILPVMIGSVIYSCNMGGTKGNLWYNSGVEFIMFAAGIMLAYIFSMRDLPRMSTLLRCFLFLVGCGVSYSAEYFFRLRGVDDPFISAPDGIIGYLLVMLGCSIILVAVLGYSGRLPKSLIYLGKISYGLYVFHVWAIYLAVYLLGLLLHMAFDQGATPLRLVALKDLLAFALTILMATASYKWLEKPFLKLKHRFEVIRSRPA
jgi:peptidoglycan/LPS O-acetylase OafA/YrhL